MSLTRLVYYSMVAGGWAAFCGFVLAEMLVFGAGYYDGILVAVLVSGIIGGALGAGLALVQAARGSRFTRLAQGLIVGAVGGLCGGLIGSMLYAIGLPRALGWVVVGLGIGVADGLFERSVRRIRNGLIGGAAGGLIGGVLFEPVSQLAVSASGMSGRALAFTIVGLCIGAMIGLAQVVFRDAWLTVVDGYRPGRQLILGQGATKLGRADHLSLPFLGSMSQDVELEHACIVMQPDGHYEITDNQTRLGTRVNDQAVRGAIVLRDGDKIRIGANIIRFNERKRDSGAPSAAEVAVKPTTQKSPPPPVKVAAKPAPPKTAPEKPATNTAPAPAVSKPTVAPAAQSPAPKKETAEVNAPAKKGPPPPPPPPKKTNK